MVEGIAHAERVAREHAQPARAVLDRDRRLDVDGPPDGRQRHLTRALEKVHELLGAAVQPGQLLTGDVHQEIVDAQPRRGRHEVLDGPDPDAERAHGRGEVAVDHMIGVGRDEGAIRRPEENAGIAPGGGYGQANRLSGVETETLDCDRASYGRLMVHGWARREQARCHTALLLDNMWI